MGRIENTVFISYRRTNLPWALAIYQNLTAHGYDVFFDFESVNSGDFEQVILGNIRARAHFVVVLTPSMLERINEPNDWVRREIETALDEKRNIVPLFFEGFNFSTPSIAKQLNGKLEQLKKYGGFDVPANYFNEAMDRLRNRYLNVALDAVIHPISSSVQYKVEKQQAAANKETQVKQKELTAQEWFEKGYKSTNLDEKIHCYTEAIRLKPDDAGAYVNRGLARFDKNDLDGAIQDYSEAIRLKPDYANAYNKRGVARKIKGDLDRALDDYNLAIKYKYVGEEHLPYYNRGITRNAKGDLEGAIQDYTEAIRIKPDYAEAYYGRGNARYNKGDLEGAIQDCTDAIRLKPDYANAYNNRGLARFDKSDLDGAIQDYSEAIRLKPDDSTAYNNRGVALKKKGNLDSAIKDYTDAIRLKPDYASAYINRGIVWDEKNDYYSAIADYQKGIDLGSKNSTVLPRINYLREKIK